MTKGEAIDRLLMQYAAQRRENEQTRDARVREARETDPRIARLMDENANLFAAGARKLLADRNGAARCAAELRESVLKNQKEIKRLLAGAGYPESYLDPVYRCAQCRDTGYTDEERQHFCPCFLQNLAREMAQSGQIAESFDSFDESIYPTPEQKAQSLKARDICMRYADEFPGSAEKNLLLTGSSGLGKTFLLNCVAERVAQRGFPAMRVTAFRMLEAMRKYHLGQEDEKGSVFESMLGADMLLIDDLGSEPMLRNVTIEYLFLLLNERAAAHRHTVIATNLSVTQLQERYGERVMSRLLDRRNTIALRLTGDDLRMRK